MSMFSTYGSGARAERSPNTLAKLAAGVKLLGTFTVLAGVVILAGAVSAAAVKRGREIALLKTLGSTRGQVIMQFVVERALLGLAGGGVLAYAVVTRVFELGYDWRPGFLVITILLTTMLTAATGVAAGWSALNRRPMEVLRGE